MKFVGTIDSYAENAPYSFTWEHILLICLTVAICVIIPLMLRKSSHKTIWRVVFWLWIITVVLDVVCITTRIIIEGHFDLSRDLEVQISSWFKYIAPFYLWGKGWLKKMGMGFLCTISLFGGLIVLFFPSALEAYPAFSFFGITSIVYHVAMLLAGVILWVTEYRPEHKDLLLAFIPTILASIVAITVDFTVPGVDYMFYVMGSGPLKLLKFLPQWAYTSLVFVGYLLFTALFFYVPLGILKLVEKSKKQKQ